MRLYIDPGTGSMLFSLAIGLLSVIWFGARKLYMKVKYLTPGKAKVDAKKKDIVIYGEDKRYWTTFKGILDEFERRKINIIYFAGSEDDPLLHESYKYVESEVIGLGNKAYAKLNFLDARIVLATTPGLDVFQWKRSKDVDWYVHMSHSLGGGTAYRMFGTQFYDAILLCSDVFIPLHRELEAKRESEPKEIVIVGQTYMDYLMDRKVKHNNVPHKKTRVLLAPSWGQNSILNRYGERFIDALISTGFDITIRPHPQSFIAEIELIERLQVKYPEGELFHWNSDADNFDVLSASDIMISDFSGVIYDYVFTFERPIIYVGATPDTSVQDEWWLDEPYWGTTVLPRLGVEFKENDIGSIKEIIEGLINNKEYAESITSARDDYWQNRGHAAEAVVDYLINKCQCIRNEVINNAGYYSGCGNGETSEGIDK